MIVKTYALENNHINSTTQFLRFEMLTLVPFERNLTNPQIIWP